MLRLILLLVVLPCMAFAAPNTGVTESRIALVIGNAAYHNGVLRNPVNDARAVASTLGKLGFDVLLKENLSREGMHQAVKDFQEKLTSDGVGLFYYAGHGMQVNGRNFLIPVDADIQNEDDIEFRGMDANFILSRMDTAHTRVNLLILDACRNNPFARNTRSSLAGLAQMEAPKGTLIAFSTSPGALAVDGKGNNSIYTHHLVDKLGMPAIPVELLFKEVRIAVSKETKNKQIPWESSSLMGDFYFVPPTNAPRLVTAPLPVPAQKPAAPPVAPKLNADVKSAASSADSMPSLKQKGAERRDFNREGYEIGVRAHNLTADELPQLIVDAKNHNVVAQTTLGWAYLLGKGAIDGRGIPRNNGLMVKWTRAAAQQGYPVAQNNLGAIYMDGVGVKLDRVMARKYFKLAADQGYLTAKRNLMQAELLLTGKFNPEQIKDALTSFPNAITPQMGR